MVEAGKALHEMRVYDGGTLPSEYTLDLRTSRAYDCTENEKVRRAKLKIKMEKLERAN